LTHTPSLEQLLPSSFSERKFERELKICEVARQILSFCHYRHAINHQYYVRPASRHAAMGARREQTSFIEIDLAHPMHWYEQAYRRELASVSGCFILNVIEELDKKRLILLVARQGRGYSLRLSYTLAESSNGVWHLSRKRLQGKYKTYPRYSDSVDKDDYYRPAMMAQIRSYIDAVLCPQKREEDS
jgi:hypothetical protein